jgi:hypothetical protein
LGTIAFEEGDVEVYDPGTKSDIAFCVKRGTVLIDCTINHVDVKAIRWHMNVSIGSCTGIILIISVERWWIRILLSVALPVILGKTTILPETRSEWKSRLVA